MRDTVGPLSLGEPEDVIDRAPARGYERKFLATYGFDDMLAGIGDLWGSPVADGIRIPQPASNGADLKPYLMLAVSADLNAGDRVSYWSQGLWIASVNGGGDGGGAPPFYVDEKQVTTPGWRFQDGEATFLLCVEPRRELFEQQGPFDMMSFRLMDSSAPAMLYLTAGFPGAPAFPGYLGLNAYTPPPVRGPEVIAVSRGVRVPWDSAQMERLGWEAPGACTVRAYVRVWQTDPSKRDARTFPATSYGSGEVPEEAFLQIHGSTTRYHRAGVRLVIDRRI